MAHGGGGRAKVTPNLAMDEEGTRMLNLTVLQRLDPAVEDILITAGHVTLYDFDTNLNQWVGVSCPASFNLVGLAFIAISPDNFDVGVCFCRAGRTWKGRFSSSRGSSPCLFLPLC